MNGFGYKTRASVILLVLSLSLSGCPGKTESDREVAGDDEISGQMAAPSNGTLDRTSLPILPPEHAAITELDARNAKPPGRGKPSSQRARRPRPRPIDPM